MENLLNRYTLEVKNKILLKEISDKNEKQILFQAFKYFDSNTNGYCNYDTFIKVNQKIGVIMPNPQDLQQIFFYFDINNEGIINYKDFIDKIFISSSKQQNVKNNKKNDNYSPKNINYSNTSYYSSYSNKKENVIFNNNINNRKYIPPYKKPFFNKIVNSLLNNDIGPSLALLLLHQGFILGDSNFMNQITIEEFIKIINDNNIELSISDIQMLFHSYELKNDGFFFYEEMFKDLINIYWNNQRQKISERKSEEIINLLNKEGGLKINLLENLIYVPKNYENFFWNKLNIYDANEYYKELMKKYIGLKRVLNCPRDTFLNINDLEDIMKYISFGIKNNDDFNKTINYIFCLNQLNNNFLDEENEKENENFINKNYKSYTPTKNKNNISKIKKQNNINKNNINIKNEFKNNTSLDYFITFRKYFIDNGIITFLNILKTFQYYDNGSKEIKKNDFIKIMKDYKIKLSPNIINHIFSISNSNIVVLNYILFMSQIIDKFVNNNIINLINKIYDSINNCCLNIDGKTMNLDFFKKYFNINNNHFFKEPNEVLNNILIIFERFHYDFYEKYKENNRNKKDIYSLVNDNVIKIEKNEFLWFYKFLNLFIDNENVFQIVILNDWKNILNSINYNNNTNNYNYNFNNSKLIDKKDEEDLKYDQDENILNNNDINNHNHINHNTNNKNNIINNRIKQTPILMNKNMKDINKYNNNIINNINNETRCDNQIEKNDGKNKKKLSQDNNNEIQENEEKTNLEPLQKIIIKLKKRGIRGVMNLHKQFILSSKDLSTISYEEFVKVMSYQRLSLTNDEYKNLFLLFIDEDNQNNLNFPKFIRAFKKVLNDKRLSAIEKIFTKLDIQGNDKVPIDDIKMKFNAKKHTSVLNGEKDEEEILCEFLDCFDLNYNLLITKENQDEKNMVNFEEFANFYEYVSFLYDNDDDFIVLIENCW